MTSKERARRRIAEKKYDTSPKGRRRRMIYNLTTRYSHRADRIIEEQEARLATTQAD